MTEDKAWERIVDAIDVKYGLIKFGKSDRPVADAPELTEHVAFVIFERGGERYKLERVAGPAIVDRKTMGARRAGAGLTLENVYDPTETAHRTNLYHEIGEDWQLVDLNELGL